MFYVNTEEIEIDAPPAKVWEAMTDLDSFPKWNPLSPKAKGELREGATLKGQLQVGALKVPFFPKLETVRPNEEFRWRGGVPGVFVADHRIIIDDLGEGRSRVRHHEEFTGVAAMGGPAKKLTVHIHDRYNKALKRYVES